MAWITKIELFSYKKKYNYRLLFGAALSVQEGRGGIKYARFPEGRVVGYERWEANNYGTVRRTIHILLTAAPGDEILVVPGIIPGAKILLHSEGQHYCRRVLSFLRDLEKKGHILSNIPPAYFCYAHGRLLTNQPLQPLEEYDQYINI